MLLLRRLNPLRCPPPAPQPLRRLLPALSAFFSSASGGSNSGDSNSGDWLGGPTLPPPEPAFPDWSVSPDPTQDAFGPAISEAAPEESGFADLGVDDWDAGEGFETWKLDGGDEEGGKDDVFGVAVGGDDAGLIGILEEGAEVENVAEQESAKQQARMAAREEELKAILKGPKRAFGDLVAASGISEEMLASLILLKDVSSAKGYTPLKESEAKATASSASTSIRAEMERKKQEEIASARVRQVDEKGRAYGTGRRKCSIARVWIEPGDGKFVVNDKQFDVYFPILDHRAELLQPFTVTKTLGLWDVNCTVKGGGVSGQVGAIRLGISRALQNWEPAVRPYLKSAGFLTRDPRMVERKKPGKAKARKSYQWVKR